MSEIDIFLADVLDDDAVLVELNHLLNAHGLADVTADEMLAAATSLDLPVVAIPGTGSTGGNAYFDGSEYCVAAISCSRCSISACASDSCSGWYQTSDGLSYPCGGCASACGQPAEDVLRHCCPEYYP